MRQISEQLDLAQLQDAGQGLIANLRDDGRKLHGAGCEAVGAMVTKDYPKMFFETAAEAREWLDNKYGSRGWSNCGRCGGDRMSDYDE